MIYLMNIIVIIQEENLDNVYCVGIMMIATENVIEKGSENEKRVEDQLNEKENLNVSVKENGSVIVAMKEPIHRIVPDTEGVISSSTRRMRNGKTAPTFCLLRIVQDFLRSRF